jgi:hypothetical protein
MCGAAILEQRPDGKVQRMAAKKPQLLETESNRGTAGPNPLFFGTALAVLVGLVVGSSAGHATLLQANLLFRVVVGGGVALVLYLGVVALWLAYHRRTFRKVGVGGTNVEPGDEAASEEIRSRDLEVAEFMGTTTNAIDELRRRLEKLEKRPE